MWVKEKSMFNFGLFTTHLPYLVFIAAYLFYLLSGVGNEAPESGVHESSDKIIVCQSCHPDAAGPGQRIAFYDSLYARLNESSSLRSPAFYPAETTTATPDERIKGERYSYQAFTRPPPFMG